jgi:molybdopterin converting factor small subunit
MNEDTHGKPAPKSPQGVTPMSVTVRIPTPLRTLTGGDDAVQADGNDVAQVIENLEGKYPGMKERLVDEKGVRRFVNLYLGDEDIRFLDGLQTTLKDGDEISIVPAIAGG